jgi:ATP-dependent exoDNAse (exonuclease V) alpha subunit
MFGGIPTLFGGDFAQILPVVKHGNRASTVAASIRESFLWKEMRVLALRQNMRVRPDELNRQFVDWLYRLSYNPSLRGNIELFHSIARSRQLDLLCERIYPLELLQRAVDDYSVFRSRAILTPRNKEATDLNENLINSFLGTETSYYSIDTVDFNADAEATGEAPPVEVLNAFLPASLPPSRLRLKVGAPIILLRNLSPKNGMCNGTRLCVTRLGRRYIQARILGGDFDGQERLIPRIQLQSSPDEHVFIVRRIQFPVRLYFAMTINKSQGQSFDVVGVDLRHSVFSHGQLYVALSRTTDVNNLIVLLPENGQEERVLNIVYPEALLEELS